MIDLLFLVGIALLVVLVVVFVGTRLARVFVRVAPRAAPRRAADCGPPPGPQPTAADPALTLTGNEPFDVRGSTITLPAKSA